MEKTIIEAIDHLEMMEGILREVKTYLLELVVQGYYALNDEQLAHVDSIMEKINDIDE